jgi:microsomal dipeptidase-like Zn-dependent dipeptidase
MLVDLHAHYPMHLLPPVRGRPFDVLRSTRMRREVLDRVRAHLVDVAGRVANHASPLSGPRVTIQQLREGDVGVALSVLHSPFDEMDLLKPYGALPDPRYLGALMRQIDEVERDVAEHWARQARVVRSPGEMLRAADDGVLALVHCVEGGYHLGATEEAVDGAVTALAARGVAYITLAHLFWRGVATNCSAIPFLPDRLYDRLFPQPPVGLSDLGRAAVRAMAREGVLIDLSHMSDRSMRDTFELLDEEDPARRVPVVATHVGHRFGHQRYNLDAGTIERIAERDGVVGLILAEHQVADGLRRRRTRTLEDSLEVLAAHVDAIAGITGSLRHVAIGSDLDGFIKPTLAGLDSAAAMVSLQAGLAERYGARDAERICSGNAVRLLRTGWRGTRSAPAARAA